MKIIVASTPKTGNTWMTHLLAAIYGLPEVELPPVFDAVLTEGQGPDWVALQHYYPEPDLLAWAKQHQVLFVTTVRHPGDLLVSLWHMLRNKGYPSSADLGLSTMLLDDGDQMGEHTTQYMREDFYHGLYISLDWMKSEQSFIVRYEDLWRDPVKTLTRLTGSIQPVTQDRIESAIDLCDLRLLRKLYNDPEGKFYRKGGPGSWRDELPDAVVDVFRSCEPYPTLLRELGYTLDPQDPLIDAPAKPRVSTNPFLKSDEFDNGVKVPTIVVKQYLLLDSALKARWFGTETATSDGSFFAWLNAPVEEDPQLQDPVPVITNLAHYIIRQRPDLREAFPDVFGKDRIKYAFWFVRHAAAGYDLDQSFITPVQDTLLAWGNMLVEEDPHQLQAVPTLTNLALYIYHVRPDLQAAFPDVFGADRVGFAGWFLATAQSEYTSDHVLGELVPSSVQMIQETLPRPQLTRYARRLEALSKRMLAYISRKPKKNYTAVDGPKDAADYQSRIDAQGESWGKHFLDGNRPWQSWLEHPLISAHYQEHMMVNGKSWWVEYVKTLLDGPARRSLDLGCASGFRGLDLFKVGGTQHIEGIDISDDMIAEAEKLRQELGAPGRFWKADVNACSLPPNTYDLIFSCHSFHHFLELEHVMRQVHDALTVEGLFMLEEFVGPTQFQWTKQQVDLVRALLAMLPAELRLSRSGARKDEEPVLPPNVLDAASPFEAIRSADIVPLFECYFDVVVAQSLGGTIQHLLYNGIIHNFDPDEPQACRYIEAIFGVEDALIEAGLLPADFMLLIGKRKDG